MRQAALLSTEAIVEATQGGRALPAIQIAHTYGFAGMPVPRSASSRQFIDDAHSGVGCALNWREKWILMAGLKGTPSHSGLSAFIQAKDYSNATAGR
ncbi:hypothetical protein [Mesorhizobium sp. A556]